MLGLTYTRFCDVCVNQAGMVSRPSWGCALVAFLYFHIQLRSGIINGKYIEPCRTSLEIFHVILGMYFGHFQVVFL